MQMADGLPFNGLEKPLEGQVVLALRRGRTAKGVGKNRLEKERESYGYTTEIKIGDVVAGVVAAVQEPKLRL